MKKLLFIYNPVSGTGAVKRKFFEIVEFFVLNKYVVTLCPVRELNFYLSEHKKEFESFDRIVCSGGDGTLNIVFSLLKTNNVKMELSYIPTGSTNDYAYSLGINCNFDDALKATVFGTPHHYDVGRFQDKYFLYVAGFGMFTSVSYNTSQKSKNLLGHTAYVLEGIKQLSDIKAYHMIIHTDEAIYEDDFILGLITNSLSVGGIKTIVPKEVKMDDGEFEVILIRMPKTLMEIQGIIISLLGEKFGENTGVIYCKTRELAIYTSEDVAWTLDGEYGGEYKDLKIANLKREISIIM